MTTITIKQNIKNLDKRTYNTYEELMEELAELHGYKILWQIEENIIPEDAKKALIDFEKTSNKKLLDI